MRYIVFEGVDGSGKTTLAKMLYERLPDPKIFTKEPGTPHSDFCVNIRKMILDGAAQDISKHTYAYLFAADREEHMRRIVTPSLKEGKWVVSDRSVISDYAYRPNHGNHVRRRHLKQFLELDPIVIYVVASSIECVGRMTARGALNEFEKAHVVDKMFDLQKAYMNVALRKYTSSGNRTLRQYILIDNSGTLEESWDQLKRLLRKHEIYL